MKKTVLTPRCHENSAVPMTHAELDSVVSMTRWIEKNVNIVEKYLQNFEPRHKTALRSQSRWSRNYLRPGAEAGAKIIFLIHIYCSQFGGC